MLLGAGLAKCSCSLPYIMCYLQYLQMNNFNLPRYLESMLPRSSSASHDRVFFLLRLIPISNISYSFFSGPGWRVLSISPVFICIKMQLLQSWKRAGQEYDDNNPWKRGTRVTKHKHKSRNTARLLMRDWKKSVWSW